MMESNQPSLSEIVRESVSNTTAHAIGRAVCKNRDPKVRIIWLVAFACFCGLLTSNCITFVRQLIDPNVKSVTQSDALSFEFPDVYFCSTLQAAGSTLYLLNETEASPLRAPFNNSRLIFEKAMDIMALNRSSLEFLPLLRLKPRSIIQSLSYQLLADTIGLRKALTFYKNSGVLSVGSLAFSRSRAIDIKTMHHPNHLKCFKLALTKAEADAMQNVNNRLEFSIQLDPYVLVFRLLNLYDGAPLPELITNDYIPRNVFAFDWNLDDPTSVDIGSGMHLYLMPRGHYPSHLTTQRVTISPGRAYDIAIRMRDSQLEPSDFPNQCIDQHDSVQFYNPYSGGADNFSYSEAYCYYTEIARAMQQDYNCSIASEPLPLEFRHLNLCLNVTAAPDNETLRQNMLAAVRAQLSFNPINSNWSSKCATMHLCKRRVYEVVASFGMWPNEASYLRLVNNIVRDMLANVNPEDRSQFRAFQTVVQSLKVLSNISLQEYENGVATYFSRCCIKVSLRAESALSSLTTFSIDYGFPQLVADVGGVFGLYLGGSLLTLFELLEILHDMLACIWGRRS